MRAILGLILSAACSFAWAETTVSVVSVRALSGLVAPEVVGELVIHSGETEKAIPGVIATVVSDKKFVLVEARKSLFEDGKVAELSTAIVDGKTTARYLVTGSGKYSLEVTAFDPGLERFKQAIELGPVKPDPEPDPGPGPTPDVPPDAFDNIGQRVATWTANAPSNPQVGAIYKKYSQQMRTDPSTTINDIFAAMAAELAAVPSYDQYVSFRTNVNADMKQRWPMSKGVAADYMVCIARGLGVQ